MPNPDAGADQAILALTYLGCTCTRLQEGEAACADLRARLGDESYLVEVKSRASDREVERRIAQNPRQLQVQHGSIVARERTANRARDAYKQLRNTRRSDEEFLLFYYLLGNIVGRAGEAQAMEYSLNGRRNVLLFHDGKKTDPVPTSIFVYSRAAFAKMPELHGALIQEDRRLFLSVNWTSPTVEAFRSSSLYSTLREHKALQDHARPGASANQAIIVPEHVDMTEEAEHAWLAKRTGATEILEFPMQSISVTTGIPKGG